MSKSESIPHSTTRQEQVDLVSLKKHILTAQEYMQQPFARETVPGSTYVYTIEQGNKSITFFGSNHSRDPKDPQFEEIAENFKRTNPQIAYIEGNTSINGRAEEVRRRMATMSTDEAVTRGESFYTLKLAVDAGIDFESPEPTGSSEILHLTEQGFSRHDIFNFYMFRAISQYQRNTTEQTVESLREYLIPHIRELQQDSNWNADEVQQFVERLFEELTLENPFLYRSQVDPIPWEGNPQTIINEVSRSSSSFRDQHLLERIAKGLETHERLFVTYGSAHAVKLEPALRELMKKM